MPPSKAGKRLNSERTLSERFGIDRMKVQRALDVLVERGILARRPGSGTFVRKVPKVSKGTLGKSSFQASDLFAERSSTPIPRQIETKHRKLKLGLLTNERWESETNRAMVAGIVERVNQEGHDLEIYNASDNSREPHHSKKLRDRLRKSTCDGYFLWSLYAQIFHEAFGPKVPPAVYLGESDRQDDVNFAPMIRINLEDAIVRAVRLLNNEGYEKIGLIHFGDFRAESEQMIYDDTLSKLGTSYRSMEACVLDQRKTLDAVKRMFLQPKSPEAIYVADDIIFRSVAPAFKKIGLVPGEDFGLITHASRGNPEPSGFKWSKMEFNPSQTGRMAVDSLLRDISTAEEELCSFEHIAVWKPGETHQIAGKK